jgi:hypothetical protein
LVPTKRRNCLGTPLQTQTLAGSVGCPAPVDSDGLTVKETALFSLGQERNRSRYILGRSKTPHRHTICDVNEAAALPRFCSITVQIPCSTKRGVTSASL